MGHKLNKFKTWREPPAKNVINDNPFLKHAKEAPAQLIAHPKAGNQPTPVWTGLIAREKVEALRAIADAARAIAEYADKWEPPPNQLVMYLADKVTVLDEMEAVKCP